LIQETRPQIELYLLKTVKILKKFNNCVLNAARNITSKGETTTNSIVVFYLSVGLLAGLYYGIGS